MFLARVLASLMLCCTLQAFAEPVALDDEELSQVQGQDGVSLFVHLELSTASLSTGTPGTQLLASFNVSGVTTYAVVQDLAGTADLFGITLDVRNRPDGQGTYIDLGLPTWVGFTKFGFGALGAQTDPTARVPASASYGALQLNGTANVTGHVYLWAAP